MPPTAEPLGTKILPAGLEFLAIYNPSLGTTDDTLDHQIVYYSSSIPDGTSTAQPLGTAILESRDTITERDNEQLRQIGLAQGMVAFGGTFSGGKSVDAIETKKSSIILHELESGWWILTSINLSVVISGGNSSEKSDASAAQYEYSSREVKPASLLLADLLRAHATFLLHHASSLSALFVRTRRAKFVGILGRYWDNFLSNWNVLMHGNPATNLYGGIKLAASGELGIGVGEEERGSGERAALEGFVGRVDGLVDVVVSKFGDEEPNERDAPGKHEVQWLGSRNDPGSEDGVIFLGVDALSRKSLRDVSHWIEDLYKYGTQAYGVVDNPSSNRQSRRDRDGACGSDNHCNDDVRSHHQQPDHTCDTSMQQQRFQQQSVHILPPNSLESENHILSEPKQSFAATQYDEPSNIVTETEQSKSNRFMNYLKMGYGTHWSIRPTSMNDNEHCSLEDRDAMSAAMIEVQVTGRVPLEAPDDPSTRPELYSSGQFLIGLLGEIEDGATHEVPETLLLEHPIAEGLNTRLLLRTLTVELQREVDALAETEISIDLGGQNVPNNARSEHTGMPKTSFEVRDRNKTKKLRVVVYLHRPFIFVLLFELRADSLALTSLYRSLHIQMKALVKPLKLSTAFRPEMPDTLKDGNTSSIYSFVWNPKLLTVASTIPNIPGPAQGQLRRRSSYPWSRIEALGTHLQIINIYMTKTNDPMEMEMTCKTSRGWWVVWTRLPDHEHTAKGSPRQNEVTAYAPSDSAEYQQSSDPTSSKATSTVGSSLVSGQAHPFLDNAHTSYEGWLRDKEIFLIRKASNYANGQSSGTFALKQLGREDGRWKMAPSHGIGIDTRKYIQSLLNSQA